MLEQRIKATFGQYQVPAVVHAVQGDTGRVFIFESQDRQITGAETAALMCIRPDGTAFSYAGTVDPDLNEITVALDIDGGALSQAGVVAGQLVMQENGQVLCSFKLGIIVEEALGGEATPEDITFLDGLQAQLDAWIASAGSNFVPSTRTVNGKALSSNITINAEDVPYDNTASGLTADDVQEAVDELESTKASKSTTINGKSLAEDRVIYAQDIPSKNLLPNNASTTTSNGVTFTVNDDGSISTSGTASSGIQFTIGSLTLKSGIQYAFTGCPSGGDLGSYFINFSGVVNDTGNGATATPASDVTTNAVINIVSGTNMNGKTFRPMIRLASIEDDSYVPYAKTNVELTRTENDSIALASGWIINDDTSAQLYKSNRLVTFNLCAYPTSKNLSIGWNTVGTMPQGFRPSGTITFNASIYGSGNLFLKTERVQLKADGVLQIYSQTARSGDVIRVLIFGSYISA